MWITTDPMVGQKVYIYTCFDEEEIATVLAVSDTTANIKVKLEDGAILIGNQWEPAD